MKKVLVIALIVFAGLANQALAQAPKFGHIDIQQLIMVMPERKTALEELDKITGELEEMLTNLQTELQTMYQEYSEKQETMSDLIRKAKADEITAKQQRIETFRAQADQQLQQKQAELQKPIFERADSAIAVVAKEQGLIYVFDVSSRVVLYKSNQSIDVLPLVKKVLKIE